MDLFDFILRRDGTGMSWWSARRTSAAEAALCIGIYGMAEAMPLTDFDGWASA